MTTHTTPRIFAALRGLAALLTLIATVAGLPVVLAVVAGNPLPSTLPTLTEIGDALARPADDTLLLGVLRAVSWLLWSAFCLSTLLEATGHACSRQAPHLPGLGGLQRLTGKLITTILLMNTPASTVMAAAPAPIVATSLAANSSPADPLVGQRPVPYATESTGTGPTASTMTTHKTSPRIPNRFSTPAGALSPSGHPRTHTVQPGDTLWDIAEAKLGNAERWPEIYRLNRDLMSYPQVILPGWTLKLPTIQPSADVASPRPRRNEPGEQRRPPAAQRPPGQVPPDRPEATTPPSPSSSHPASTLPPTKAASGAGSADPSGYGREQEITLTSPITDEDSTQVLFGTYATVFATGMLAGGVLTKLAQMRHRQRQYRRRGRRIALPASARPHRTERRLARQAAGQADPQAGRLLRRALRQFGAVLRRDQLPVPAVVGVHLTAGGIEILLTEPASPAPAPFTVMPGTQDMCWHLSLASLDPLDPYIAPYEEPFDDTDTGTSDGGVDGSARSPEGGGADDGSDPLPGLLTVGRTDSGGHLLIDVEGLGVVGCTGAPDHVDGMLRSLATEAATNPWQGWFDAILVGFDELSVSEGRVHTCDDLDEAVDLLSWRADTIHAHLEDTQNGIARHGIAGGLPDRAGRGSTPHVDGVRDIRKRRVLAAGQDDDLVLTLLIARHTPNADQLDQLIRAVDDTGGVAAVLPVPADTDVPARFTLQPGEDPTKPGASGPARRAGTRLRIDPLQLTVQHRPLTRDDYDDIVTLLAAASNLDDTSPTEPPYTPGPSSGPFAATSLDPSSRATRPIASMKPEPTLRGVGAQAAVSPWLAASGCSGASN